MIKQFDCQMEIDTERGVIYIHSKESGITLLRIGGLPSPIPALDADGSSFTLDVVYPNGCNWEYLSKQYQLRKDDPDDLFRKQWQHLFPEGEESL